LPGLRLRLPLLVNYLCPCCEDGRAAELLRSVLATGTLCPIWTVSAAAPSFLQGRSVLEIGTGIWFSAGVHRMKRPPGMVELGRDPLRRHPGLPLKVAALPSADESALFELMESGECAVFASAEPPRCLARTEEDGTVVLSVVQGYRARQGRIARLATN